MMQSVIDASKIYYNQDVVENAAEDSAQQNADETSHLSLENDYFEGDTKTSKVFMHNKYNNLDKDQVMTSSELESGKEFIGKVSTPIDVPASLTVTVKYAWGLKNPDGSGKPPSPFIVVEAGSSKGTVTKKTSTVAGTENPSWTGGNPRVGYILEFGCEIWDDIMTIQIWNDEGSNKEAISPDLLVGLPHGSYCKYDRLLYFGDRSRSYLKFKVAFDKIRENKCKQNPCQNGGTCVHKCSGIYYSCECQSGYVGTNCENYKGQLKVKGSASGLTDRDAWAAGQSDPYMDVTARDEKGSPPTKIRTPHRGGTNNPTWGDYLVFNENTWKNITIDIWDYDGKDRKADELCNNKVITLKPGTHDESIDCKPHDGTATISYTFAAP
jgi:hypothetical protein